MPDDIMTIITGGGKTAEASKKGVTSSKGAKKGDAPTNPLIEALTERLLKQGEGIASSSSSALQKEIKSAISSTNKAGEASAARIESERQRELGYARDAAGAKYTGALEGRTGYATQVSALRELTNTTEKSIRDLDQRYQESLLANDAATASQLAELKMKKLEFLKDQEQSFFTNVMSLANLQQSATDSLMRREEFWAGQEQQQNQFVMSMAQSAYQFEQNLGLQQKEYGLKLQELDIARERNNISRAEYSLKKSELEKDKTNTTLQAVVYDHMKRAALKGVDIDSMSSIEWHQEIVSMLGPTYPMLAEMKPEDVATFIEGAKTGVQEGIKSGSIVVPRSTHLNHSGYYTTSNTTQRTGLLPVAGRAVGREAGSGIDWLDRVFWTGDQGGKNRGW